MCLLNVDQIVADFSLEISKGFLESLLFKLDIKSTQKYTVLECIKVFAIKAC